MRKMLTLPYILVLWSCGHLVLSLSNRCSSYPIPNMMSTFPSSSNKRQRHSGGERSPSDFNNPMLQLTDIPDALLVRSAEYLSNTSCVSFAIALTSQNMMSQQPSANNMAIARASRENWDNIDLKDIQDICGRSLTDDDVRWVLLAIDAVHKIKTLKLTNCIGISGAGLEPLSGSTVLERIDLSLVGDHESPTINPEPPISVSAVVPILDSIIGAEGNSLVHVQLPKKWRLERAEVLTQFLRRFDRELNRRRFECSKSWCEEVCERSNRFQLVQWGEGGEEGWERRFYGMNTITCYQCKRNFCHSCGETCEIGFCSCCEKFCCRDCNLVLYCEGRSCPAPYQPSSCGACAHVKNW